MSDLMEALLIVLGVIWFLIGLAVGYEALADCGTFAFAVARGLLWPVTLSVDVIRTVCTKEFWQ